MISLYTAVCATIADEANHLAMVMGRGPADALTWLNPLHQDAEGNLFIRRNLWVPDGWITAASGELERPEWDVTPYAINMAAARRTQGRIVLWRPEMETPMPVAQVGKIVAVLGSSDLGLTLIPTEDFV